MHSPHRPVHARATLSHPHTQIGLAIDPPDPVLVVQPKPQPEPVDLAKSVAVWLGVISALVDRIERSPLACFIRRVNQEMNG